MTDAEQETIAEEQMRSFRKTLARTKGDSDREIFRTYLQVSNWADGCGFLAIRLGLYIIADRMHDFAADTRGSASTAAAERRAEIARAEPSIFLDTRQAD